MPLSSIISELGLVTEVHGDRLRGRARIGTELLAPGTGALRTSVLATWADVLAGLLSTLTIRPSIPVTLDLEVQVHRPATTGRDVLGEATVLKAGRSVVVCEVRFHEDGDAAPFAVAHTSFMASANPDDLQPDAGYDLAMQVPHRLSIPLAERAEVRVLAPGRVEMPKRPDGLNAADAIQGGLIALAAEEAATSFAERPALLSSLALRYLRPFAIGPAVAEAEPFDDLSIIRITDAGSGKLGALATARLSDA